MKEIGKKKLRRVSQGAVIIIFILLGIAVYLAYSGSQTLKNIIREQHNEQQLFLARSTAGMIQKGLQSAISDIILLNSMPALQYAEPVHYETLLISVLPVLNRDNISYLRRVDRNGQILFTADDQGILTNPQDFSGREVGAFLSWASDPVNRGRVMISGIRRQEMAGETRLFMDMIIPTYEDTVTENVPRPSHRFSGYLRSTLNINGLMRQTFPDIRSEGTGYAWVMDGFGLILNHPERALVGKNAFSLSQAQGNGLNLVSGFKPDIKEMILKGKEGTGTYLFTHPDRPSMQVEKLIALSPIKVQSPFTDLIWSVAVSVPIEEVEGNISFLYQKQLGFQGIVFIITLICAGVIFIYQLRWSTILEHEVEQKTQHIQKYAADLKRSETKYRTLIESAEDLIFTVDSNGIIQTANQHMQSIFDLKRDNLITALFPHQEGDRQITLIKEVLSSGKGKSVETKIWTDDSEHWFNIQYMPLKEHDAKRPLVLGIARDITDRKKMDMQLINTEKLASLGTMAAGVAHEINNPLGIILGFCELLQEKTEPGTEEYDDIKMIEKKGLHCKAIVESLLSFARSSDDTEDLSNINACIQEVLSMLKHNLDKKNITIAADLDPESPHVRGNSRRLLQVILNILTNSIHAMAEKGGTISISTQRNKNNHVLIQITDQGYGIPKDVQNKVFDPFFTTKKVGEGTGLGLSVSYGIISDYGGTIRCQSYTPEEKPENHGTTFFISLPLAEHAQGMDGALSTE